ncbi:MAG: glycosyltransferase family 2 protein [Steroidobacteraceae bacterium]
MNIAVCIATYRREDRLAALLDDLSQQSLLPTEIVVVDNDATGSARATVEQHRERVHTYSIHYDIQPARNIALTRNRTVELATADWLAFIDDDERAPEDWLSQLVAAMERYSTDGVLGPVVPMVPDTAPQWIRRGRFYDFPRFSNGAVVPLNCLRFGNILLRGKRLREEPVPFDPAYGLTTGEDADLLIRLAQKGAMLVWCDDAVVWEPVESKRLSLRWLLQRALSGGQEYARKTISGRYGPVSFGGRVHLIGQALAQFLIAAGLTVVALPLGRHRAAAWLVKASANLGKLSIFWGWRYQEYA